MNEERTRVTRPTGSLVVFVHTEVEEANEISMSQSPTKENRSFLFDENQANRAQGRTVERRRSSDEYLF